MNYVSVVADTITFIPLRLNECVREPYMNRIELSSFDQKRLSLCKVACKEFTISDLIILQHLAL